MNRSALALALSRFLEANRQIDRNRTLRPLERGYEKKLAKWFADQGQTVVMALRPIAPLFAESGRLREISPAEWEYLVNVVMMGQESAFIAFASEFTFAALMAGYTEQIEGVGGIGLSFNLDNPRAVAYAQGHAATLVRQINDTTRGYLRTLLTQATAEGWSWTRTQDAIAKRFADFSTERAGRVARFEMGDAYEAGNETAVRDMQGAGLRMEKAWQTIGDERVRPSHQANQAEGWIAFDAAFSSGDVRSPTDPGCRCVMLYRRAKGKLEEPPQSGPNGTPVSNAL